MKCVICNKVKGKRGCSLHSMQLICSRCCAQVRNESCSDCFYHKQSDKYAIEKSKSSGKPQQYVALIDPEVDDAVDKALIQFSRGMKQQGKERMEQLVKDHPDIYTVHFGMGTIHAQQEELDVALDCFNRALEIFPLYAAAWYNKGGIYRQRFELRPMVLAYQKVIEYGHPDDDHVQVAKQTLQQMDENERKLGSSLENWMDGMAFFDQGHNQMVSEEYQAAAINFKKATECTPHIPSGFGNLGICLGFLGEKQKALEAFDKALEADSSYEPAIVNRMLVEKLKEGQSLQGKTTSAKYYAEYGDHTERSYMQEFLDKNKKHQS